MKKLLALAAFTGTLMLSQTPDLTGVWRADLQKSKRMGPPVITYLTIIEEKNAVFNNRTKEEALQFTDTTGTWGRGEQRAKLSFFLNGKLKVGSYQGVPTEMLGSVEGNKVMVKAETAGGGGSFTRTYELSADGKTLTMNEDATGKDGHTMQSTIVMNKQDDAAGEQLRKPEEIASAHFKNVKTDALKNLPASEFIDTMHYYAWALGKDCLFCHVEHKFDSDDKKEKVTARKMIDMTAAIDEHNFERKPAVRCFTCHEGNGHPLTHQLFADEIEAAKARAAREAAEREAHRPPPPPGGGPGGPGGPPAGGPPPQH